PRSSSSTPAARCSGSSQVAKNTCQVLATTAQAPRMIRASAMRADGVARATAAGSVSATERVPEHDGLVAIRAGGDHVERHLGELREALEIAAGIAGQRAVVGHTDG